LDRYHFGASFGGRLSADQTHFKHISRHHYFLSVGSTGSDGRRRS
jgi:hypothetical protein